MPTRRILMSVLAGFVGTYTSRYSDYRGYWLHGQFLFDSPRHEFNLLCSPPHGEAPLHSAWRLANRRFAEQLFKSGLTLEVIREATLQIQMDAETVRGWHGNQMSDGHLVQFRASAVTDNGHTYVQKLTVFVAPHDPEKEQRRLPDDWGNQ